MAAERNQAEYGLELQTTDEVRPVVDAGAIHCQRMVMIMECECVQQPLHSELVPSYSHRHRLLGCVLRYVGGVRQSCHISERVCVFMFASGCRMVLSLRGAVLL